MNEPFHSVTDCPHCKAERSFGKATFYDGRTMMAVQGVRAMDNSSVGFTMGGPAISVLFKCCKSCGFMAPFSKDIVITGRVG